MHILAGLGFMEFSLYIGSKKVKQAIGYILREYACTILSRTKRRYNLEETPRKTRAHTKGVMPKDCPNYIKESN